MSSPLGDLLADLPEATEIGDDDPTVLTTEDGSGPVCQVCSETIPWSGRGRRPKSHKECRTRTATTGRRTTRTRSVSDEQLTDDIHRELIGFGKSISPLLPTASVVCVSRAERTAEALVLATKGHKKSRQFLVAATRILPLFDVSEFLTMMVIAAMVDVGKISPDSMLANMGGVSELYHELNDDTPAEPQNLPQPFEFPEQQVPLRFQPVRTK
jgi:hypothetical protein